MKPHIDDALDLALARQLDGEAAADILPAFPEHAHTLEGLLPVTAVLATLPPIPLPDPANQQADRAAFLVAAAQWSPTAVSATPLMRLKRWLGTVLPWFGPQTISRPQEKNMMSSLILKIALVMTALLSVAGGTAVVAAESLPDSPIYPVKIALEDARLALTNNPETAVALHTDMAAERVREMEQLALADHIPAVATLERLQYHLEAALDLAAQLPDQNMAGALQQIQTMVQTRTRALDQAQAQAPAAPQAALTQARTLLQNAGEVVAAGLQDPQTIRRRQTTNRPEDAPVQPEMTPRTGSVINPPLIITGTRPITTPVQLGPCATGECGTPQGEGPYGPSRPGPQPEEPGAGPGPGPGAPQTPGEPNPGNGPGDPPGGDNGNQYGPQPEDAGNGAGMPGGNPDGIPVGGQNQNGPQYKAPGN